MPEPYFVILDNSLMDEPLAPGLPYWTYPLATLPTPQTAGRFVDDVLYQSELWANAVAAGAWTSLRLLERRHMCPRCGHLLVRMGDDERALIHIVWFIARNPQPQIMGHEAALHLGLWHGDYLEHQCQEDFFADATETPAVSVNA